jgi:pimeloyl-ACP methyl ester carboxylesterase
MINAHHGGSQLKPFRIHVPDERLAELDERLRSTVWADEPAGTDEWEYGVPGRCLRELTDHWRDSYSWREHEAAMNRWPQLRGEVDGVTLEAPIGLAVFPRELTHIPRSVAQRHANLVHWTRMPRGGHFAPMEEPDLLVDDIRAFFRQLR